MERSFLSHYSWIAARIVFDQQLAQDKKALKHPTYVFGAAANTTCDRFAMNGPVIP